MSELKRLKDLDCNSNDEFGCCEGFQSKNDPPPHGVDVDDLRDAARKWHHKLWTQAFESDDVKETQRCLAQVKWIRDFFGLEENLFGMKIKTDDSLKPNEFRFEEEKE